MNKPDSIKRLLPFGLFGVSALAVLILFRSVSGTLMLDRDEISWFFHTEFFERAFLRSDVTDPSWTEYEGYDHPQLSKFTFGFYLWLTDRQIFEKRNALAQKYGRWGFYFYPGMDTIMKVEFAPIINSMRQLNVWFAAATVVVSGLILYLLHTHPVICLMMMAALAVNPLFQLTMIRGTADAQIIFFLFVSLLFFVVFLIRKSPVWLILFTVSVALAISSKLTGLLAVFMYIAWQVGSGVLSNFREIRWRQTALVFIAVFLIWVILNPTTYANPVMNSLEFIRFRYRQSLVLQQSFPDIALWNIPDRLHAIHCTLFTAGCGSDYTQGITFNNSIVNYALLIIGLVSLSVSFMTQRRPTQFFLTAVTVIFVTIGFYLPLNSDRYYLPIYVSVVMVQFLGIHSIMKSGGKLLLTRFRVRKNTI
jgi:hypothetical protein